MEGDRHSRKQNTTIKDFYPRPPGGGRQVYEPKRRVVMSFLSTPSGWRATTAINIQTFCNGYFYPRPPGGGRQCRAPSLRPPPYFYPRPPGGGRLGYDGRIGLYVDISIHALRVEGDSNKEMFRYELIWISIHALRVEGDETDRQLRGRIMISIHALRVEGDWERLRRPTAAANFYPRPPGGGRQQKRTKFSSVFAQKGEEFASLRRGKREFAGGVLKRTNFGF